MRCGRKRVPPCSRSAGTDVFDGRVRSAGLRRRDDPAHGTDVRADMLCGRVSLQSSGGLCISIGGAMRGGDCAFRGGARRGRRRVARARRRDACATRAGKGTTGTPRGMGQRCASGNCAARCGDGIPALRDDPPRALAVRMPLAYANGSPIAEIIEQSAAHSPVAPKPASPGSRSFHRPLSTVSRGTLRVRAVCAVACGEGRAMGSRWVPLWRARTSGSRACSSTRPRG
jgi:hypothetical protein